MVAIWLSWNNKHRPKTATGGPSQKDPPPNTNRCGGLQTRTRPIISTIRGRRIISLVSGQQCHRKRTAKPSRIYTRYLHRQTARGGVGWAANGNNNKPQHPAPLCFSLLNYYLSLLARPAAFRGFGVLGTLGRDWRWCIAPLRWLGGVGVLCGSVRACGARWGFGVVRVANGRSVCAGGSSVDGAWSWPWLVLRYRVGAGPIGGGWPDTST